MQINGVSKKRDLSLPDWSYVIAGLDPAISPAKGIPASGRGNDIVSYKSKLELTGFLQDFLILVLKRQNCLNSDIFKIFFKFSLTF